MEPTRSGHAQPDDSNKMLTFAAVINHLKLLRLKRTLIPLLCGILIAGSVVAQEHDKPSVDLIIEARGDYQRDYVDGQSIKDNSGFKGQFLNLIVKSKLNRHFSFFFRHRMNQTNFDANFFDATDWLEITYAPTSRLTIAGGKEGIAIGGYEYDRVPIDLYFCSEFWNAVPCYAWGATVGYKLSDNDQLSFQFCESPFRGFYKNADMYAYNLFWTGTHGLWSTIWSVNMIEWRQGRFINYIALGNEFRLGPKFTLQLDYMNRASSGQKFFKDCSVIGELTYRPINRLHLTAKCAYDVNRSGTDHDLLVHNGTELTRVGAVVEYLPPVRNFDIRLHAAYCYSWGTNTNPDGFTQDRQSFFTLGATWKLNITDLFRKSSKKSEI